MKMLAPGNASGRLIPRSLRHRDYTLLWSGQTVSVLGDGIYTIAIALEALRISDHPATLAYVEASRVAPNALLLLLAGAVVDRLPRRLVVLGANLLRGGAVAAIAALVAAHALNVTGLVVLSAAVGVGDAFFYPAYRAIMPELLPPELLTQGNAFNSASQTVGLSFIGPAIGGVVVALGGTSTAFAIDAGTFAVSALCLVPMRRVPAPTPSGRSMVADVGQGIRWTMRQRWLWFGILAAGVANFAGFSPTAVTIPLLVRDILHQGPVAYGATFAAAGAGGLAAAAVAGRLGSPKRRMSMIWAAYFGARSCKWQCRPTCSAAPLRSTGSSRPASRPWASCSPGCSLGRSACARRSCWVRGCPRSPVSSSSCRASATRTGLTTARRRCTGTSVNGTPQGQIDHPALRPGGRQRVTR
jgi:MFS family permease